MNELHLLIAVLINFFPASHSDEVLGCGGFLKSHVPIDFSKVEVKLITKQGIVKDRTTAAPNNGYYFVPLYDKGEMLLELSPPPGWSFKPKKVVLSIDGVNDICSQGKDINFVFQGFGITGKVESLGSQLTEESSSKGPEGVTVQLESNGEIRTTLTDQNGNFFFTPVFPGNHKVSISHPKWKISKRLVDVEVAESNTELPKNSLVIQGYDVSGSVKSENEPVKGASILLFSESKNVLVEGCIKEPLADFQIKNKDNIICHVLTDENGKFVFDTLPNGHYYAVAHYKGQNIYFQPEQIKFTVNHDSLDLQQSFEIIGFSIPGRVLRSRNVPLADVKVFLNGQEIARTDAKGSYKLEKMKAGTYKLRAEADDVIFEEIFVRMNPNLPELPDILPSAFKVCGSVISDHSQIVTFSKLGGTKFIQTETSPSGGTFCQYLSPGKYEVQVVVSEEDKQKGLQFFPLKQLIEVTSEKVGSIVFSQLKSKISGKVKCIKQEDCENLTVVLRTGKENEKTLKIKGGAYSISDMYPGTYEVFLLSNKFCWKNDKQTIIVDAATVEVPPFIQNGYTINFVSTHDTQVTFELPGQKQLKTLDIQQGRSTFCLEIPGEYLFTLESCHNYDPKTISYKTDSEVNEIFLSAQKHTLKLAIQADSDFGDIQVSVKIRTDKSERKLKYQNGIYELDILLEPTEKAVVIPQSDTLFFTPPILSVEGGEDCENVGVKFIATRGKIFEGKVKPPLAGVTVTVESTDAERLVIETDSGGVFKFPPLDSKKEYKIYANKDSYVLTGPDSNGNFLAHKLAEVIVEVLDEIDNSPLSGALLSLSGGEGYRKNLQSGENGKITFNSLSPSEYFLRPMMKEYQFEPNSKIISVQEGETVNVRLVAKRVAYSAYGQVLSLNGDSEDNMVIIASGIGNCSHYSEETTCENTGKFRIRGLQPYCSYKVIVKGSLSGDNVVERTAPDFIRIDAIKEDVRDLKLIVFRPAGKMDVLVRVYAENVDHYRSLKLKLTREYGTPTVIHTAKIDTSSLKLSKTINPGILVHLPTIPQDNKLYTLQLDSSLVQSTKWNSEVHQFSANTSFKFIDFDFNVRDSVSEQPIRQTSIFSLIFILTILFTAYNIEIVANWLNDKFNFNVNALINLVPIQNPKPVSEYYDDAQIDQIVQNINNAKKKPKPKKI
nr:nodal modulator 3 [Leptinotarsa decemlineata]